MTTPNNVWTKDLSEEDIIHLYGNNITTLDVFKDVRRQQKEEMEPALVCWKCKSIAKKLGLE